MIYRYTCLKCNSIFPWEPDIVNVDTPDDSLYICRRKSCQRHFTRKQLQEDFEMRIHDDIEDHDVFGLRY